MHYGQTSSNNAHFSTGCLVKDNSYLSWKHLLFSGTQHNIYRTVLWTEGSLTFILCFCKNPCDKDWENFFLLFAKSLRMTHILSINFFLRGIFWIFHIIQNCFICRLSDSTPSEDSGIEPRTVATLVLTPRRSNYSPRSHQKKILKSPKLMYTWKNFSPKLQRITNDYKKLYIYANWKFCILVFSSFPNVASRNFCG